MLAQLLCKRQQKAPISDVRESRAVTQVQRREDVKVLLLVMMEPYLAILQMEINLHSI